MKQKKVIIIGASSGIGREMALLYVERGYKVGITGRRQNLLNELREPYPLQVTVACFDVMGLDNEKHFRQLLFELGGLDLLIYNSGYGDVSKELNWQIENTTTKTNVNGFVEIINHAFNYFVNHGYGQIGIISSISALRGNSWAPAYSASKAFMSNYAEGLNIKARRMKKNIIVTDIRPGFIDTKMAKGNERFWIAPAAKAARQIVSAIERKKRVVYITKRWWFIAQLLKILPYFIYRRLA